MPQAAPQSTEPPWFRHLVPGSTVTGEHLDSVEPMPHTWARSWAEAPDRPVLHTTEHGWCTAGTLDMASRLVAGRLARAGLVPGDRVLMSCASSVELVIAHVAALRSGLTVLPANTAYRAPELAHLVRDAGPRAAIVDDPERASWLGEIDDTLLICGPEVDLADGPVPALDAVVREDPAMIGYTSGTTGLPKGALLSHGNLASSVEALRLAWRWTPADRLVLTLPLFHMHGLGVGIHGTLTVGASAVLRSGFDVDTVLDDVAQHDATMFFGVPTMHVRLAGSDRAHELAALRLIVSGSAPLPADLHRRIEAITGERVVERYGMTETVMLVSNPVDGERRAGTVGLPLPGVSVRLDPATSEVLVSGPNVFGGYLNHDGAGVFEDGWFRTGDLGTLSEDGYLTLTGRAKELIISGGFNVYPREVEDALRRHVAVADAAVTGTPDPEWGEIVTAHLELSPGHEQDATIADQVVASVADELAAFKRPRLVRVVEALPRNALGKVQKHLLSGDS